VLSLGLGESTHLSSKDFAFASIKRCRKSLDDVFDMALQRKKRRLSLGFLTPSFFEDNLKSSHHRRASLDWLSIHKHLAKEIVAGSMICEPKIDDDDDDSDDDDDDDDGFCGELFEPEKRKVIDPSHLKCSIEAFRAAMEQSQKSQLSIHDWDRKMGLKRSHSKTMRLSTRSRKKLNTVFKNEVNALMAKMR
jgi:hypothetical protein